ncbi:MAG: transketolase, partial [Planctomycetota bacterium]
MTLSSNERDAIVAAARQVRIDAIRMTNAASSGHPGGPLGMADFMATLFVKHLELSPETRDKKERNRFVLDNGHTCAGYYSLLAQTGLVPEDELLRFRK